MNYKFVHLIGIGGSSMSGIAMFLAESKIKVSGSNNEYNHNIEKLENAGIKISLEHKKENITNQDLVIYSKAISNDNPEILEAKRKNITLMERADFIGEMTKSFSKAICVSGTHGKSTTSSMIALCLLEANLDPTMQLGAILKHTKSNYRTGKSDYFVLEACEYKDQFLSFFPNAEVILNIDADHLDYFKTFDNIKSSFQKYVKKLTKQDVLVTNNDDISCRELFSYNKGLNISFGINNPADYQASDIIFDENGCASFKVKNHLVKLNVKGIHNVYNALACFAICDYYKVPTDSIIKGLESYDGVERRFELLATIKDNIKVYDDYAHHPTEIATTLDSVKKTKHHESWAIFQSHTYSRTIEHLNEFAEVLKNFDHIIIAKIYPARETNIYNVKEENLVDLIKKDNPNVIFIDNFDEIVNYLDANIQKDDLVISIGAGPINDVCFKLINKNEEVSSN